MKIKDIKASLEKGELFSKFKIFFLAFFAIFILLGLAIGFSIFLNSKQNSLEFKTILLSISLFVFFLCLIFMIILDIKNKKIVKSWLSYDVVMTTGKVKILDVKNTIVSRANHSYFKIEITFEIDGKKYIKTSGKNGKNEYHAVFGRYADKDINILYSAKHDQVLILKN